MGSSNCTMRGCIPSTIKYLLFIFNLLVFLTGCVVLGFSIYALVDGQTVSNLVEEGAEDLGESISVDIYKSSAIILIIASSIIVITSFLGCCGAIKENRYLLYLYCFTLLVMFFVVAVGATIAAVQNVDVIKEPLEKSMTKYNPNSSNASNLDITRAWDDVQREFSCCGVNNFTDWTAINGTIFPILQSDESKKVPASCCKDVANVTDCLIHPSNKTYGQNMNGCFTVFKHSLENSKSTIEIVTGTIIAVMFFTLNLLFGFALCLGPNGTYEQV